MKILVVEDDHEMRTLIVKTLKSDNDKDVFVEANNGLKAVNMVSGVDLILTDINMPGMSGTSLVRELRSNVRTEYIPIIAITSDSSEAMVHRLVRMNIDGFIVKPFERDRLIDTVNEARDKLRRRGMINE